MRGCQGVRETGHFLPAAHVAGSRPKPPRAQPRRRAARVPLDLRRVISARTRVGSDFPGASGRARFGGGRRGPSPSQAPRGRLRWLASHAWARSAPFDTADANAAEAPLAQPRRISTDATLSPRLTVRVLAKMAARGLALWRPPPRMRAGLRAAPLGKANLGAAYSFFAAASICPATCCASCAATLWTVRPYAAPRMKAATRPRPTRPRTRMGTSGLPSKETGGSR